jgi:hypothetical protein
MYIALPIVIFPKTKKIIIESGRVTAVGGRWPADSEPAYAAASQLLTCKELRGQVLIQPCIFGG